MIRYTRKALSQIRSLTAHDERIGRGEAVINLSAALANAEERIARAPHKWTARAAPTIVAVFYETADIPGRL